MKAKLISLASAVTLVAAFAASTGFSAPAPTGDVTKGKASFERVGCYQCHGHQGQGGREGPRIAAPVTLAWPAFLAWIRTTSGDMPPYTEKVLPERDLVDIYAYIQSVPKSPDFKTIPLLNGMMTTASAR